LYTYWFLSNEHCFMTLNQGYLIREQYTNVFQITIQW
jgi:hypothetical protein